MGFDQSGGGHSGRAAERDTQTRPMSGQYGHMTARGGALHVGEGRQRPEAVGVFDQVLAHDQLANVHQRHNIWELFQTIPGEIDCARHRDGSGRWGPAAMAAPGDVA